MFWEEYLLSNILCLSYISQREEVRWKG